MSSRSTTPRAIERGASRNAVDGSCNSVVAAVCAVFSGSAFAPGATRARFFSTTTAFDRPWLKLCRTVEVSVFFRLSVLPPGLCARCVVRLAHSFLSRKRSVAASSSRPAYPGQTHAFSDLKPASLPASKIKPSANARI